MVLCLHDFTDFWYGWRSQLKGLAESFWVVALDLKGFGDSEKPYLARHYKDEQVLEELRKFIEVINGSDKKIVIIGRMRTDFMYNFINSEPKIAFLLLFTFPLNVYGHRCLIAETNHKKIFKAVKL